MNDYIYILKRAFKCSIGVLVFLALVQPFGINRVNDGRIVYILVCSLISFFTVLFSLLLTKGAFGDYEKRNGSLKYFLVRETVANIVNTPILAFLLLMYDGWFCQRRWDMFLYIDGHFSLYNVWLMCVNVAIVSVFLCLWAFYEFRNDKLRRELDDVKAINALLEKRQEELFQREDKCEEVEEKPVMVVIEGQGQGARLEVDPSSILYVESMANYADICYISENETGNTFRVRVYRAMSQGFPCQYQFRGVDDSSQSRLSVAVVRR